MKNSQRNQFLKYFNYLWKHLLNWKIFWGKMLCMLLTCQGSEDHICWYLRYFICIYIMFKKLKYPLKFVRFYIVLSESVDTFFLKILLVPSNWNSFEIVPLGRIQTGFPTKFKLDFPLNTCKVPFNKQFSCFASIPRILGTLLFFVLYLTATWVTLQLFAFLPVTKIHLFKENKFQSHLGFEIIGKILEIEEADEEKVGA